MDCATVSTGVVAFAQALFPIGVHSLECVVRISIPHPQYWSGNAKGNFQQQ